MSKVMDKASRRFPAAQAERHGLRSLFLAVLLGGGCLPLSVQAGVPEVSGPVCVPYPGMPCPGDVASSSSSSGSGRSGYSSSGRSTKPSTNMMILQGLQQSLDQMMTPNPATLQRIQKTRTEGDQAQQQAIQAQQTQEEQRRQKALQEAEAARQRQLQELAASLQGLPGGPGPDVDLRARGTPFFGQPNGSIVPVTGTDLEDLRAAASSGFDTRGPLAGELPAAPPLPPEPTPVILQEKPVPPEKMTPEMQALLLQREAVREQKMAMQQEIDQLAAKTQLTPEESAAMAKLREDLALTLNKEGYLTFTINEVLP